MQLAIQFPAAEMHVENCLYGQNTCNELFKNSPMEVRLYMHLHTKGLTGMLHLTLACIEGWTDGRTYPWMDGRWCHDQIWGSPAPCPVQHYISYQYTWLQFRFWAWATAAGCWGGYLSHHALRMLADIWVHPTHLETQTKESSMWASLRVPQTPRRNENEASPGCWGEIPASAPGGAHCQPTCSNLGKVWVRAQKDPKDGEICLNREKPEETLVAILMCKSIV